VGENLERYTLADLFQNSKISPILNHYKLKHKDMDSVYFEMFGKGKVILQGILENSTHSKLKPSREVLFEKLSDYIVKYYDPKGPYRKMIANVFNTDRVLHTYLLKWKLNSARIERVFPDLREDAQQILLSQKKSYLEEKKNTPQPASPYGRGIVVRKTPKSAHVDKPSINKSQQLKNMAQSLMKEMDLKLSVLRGRTALLGKISLADLKDFPTFKALISRMEDVGMGEKEFRQYQHFLSEEGVLIFKELGIL
jgi:hypothetical protein